jgi:bacillolysin
MGRVTRAGTVGVAVASMIAIGAPWVTPAAAQTVGPPTGPTRTPAPTPAALAGELVAHTGGTARLSSTGGGSRVDFVGGSAAHPLAEGDPPDPEAAARHFVDRYSPVLGLNDATELTEQSHVAGQDGGQTVRFHQARMGVPVLGGDVSVRVDGAGRVLAMLGHATSAPGVGITPVIDASTAGDRADFGTAAARRVDAAALSHSTPSLQLYDPSLFDPTQPSTLTLVWQTTVRASTKEVTEFVLVDATTGVVTFHADQVERVLDRRVCDLQVHNDFSCTRPVKVEGGPPNPSADVEHGYELAGVTYAFYASRFGRDGLDGVGMPIVMSVNDGEAGAHWDDRLGELVFGSGYTVDDVVGHEMTHGVTQFTSNLFYFAQSGAINESMSDVFGEFVDLTDGHGNDDPSVRWLAGEDLPTGAIRDMANPPNFGQPDRLRSPLYDAVAAGDPHGGSGVGNKAASLITDGGSFNGHTVVGIGIDKAARIYYETDVNLLVSASDYNDLGNALSQACTNLLGVGGIGPADCTSVAAAVAATEMNDAPATPDVGHGEAPVCPTGQAPRDLFRDDMEDPLSGNWVMDNGGFGQPGPPGWGYETFEATSGVRSLTAVVPGPQIDKRTRLAHPVALPPGETSYLRFSHDEHLQNAATGASGGTVEVSVDDGATWSNLGFLLGDNPYDGSVFGAPEGVLPAFVQSSAGFMSSRADLAPLAGKNALFRFRLLAQFSQGPTAWYVDDVRVYTCTAAPSPPDAPSGVATVPGVDEAVVSWRPPVSDGGSAITGYTVTATPGGATVAAGAEQRAAVVGGLTVGPAYTFSVRATNGVGDSATSAGSAPLTLTPHGGPLFHPLTPARAVDSRFGTGTTASPWSAGQTRSLTVTGVHGVPVDHVSAVIANVTVTDATAPSHLTVWPTGVTQPTASNLNFIAGQTVANHVTVGVGVGGQISVFNNTGHADVIVDLLGYFDDGTAGGDAYTAVTPTRILDSRDGAGGSVAPWGPGEERDLSVAGASGSPVPAGATAVVLNVTGVFPSRDTHITVWPTGQSLPSSSSVNVPVGGVVSNLVTVKVGSNGQVRLRNNAGSMNIVADIMGYDAPRPDGGRFVALTPRRILDTRDGTGILGGPWHILETREIQVAGSGGVPRAGATAVVLNVTAVGPESASHITCWPAFTGRPLASNLNFDAGQTVANQVIVKIGAHGEVSCFNNMDMVDLVVDVVGFVT